MQTTTRSGTSKSPARAGVDLEWARALVRTECSLWDLLLAQPRIGAGVRAAVADRADQIHGPLDGAAMRGLDPDRALLDAVLDELSELPPDRSLLREVSALNATALRARHEIARAHTGLVAKTAREFDYGIVPLADLIQEGHVGLLNAVGRFDPERGVKFSTYAVWWIRHSVRRSLAEKGRLVRLPVSVINGGYQLTKARRALAGRLGRTPTVEDLAAATDMPVERVRRLARAMAQRSLSLDVPADDESDQREFPREAVDTASSPAERVELHQSVARLRDLMATLSEVEVDVLRNRYGLDGVAKQTLSQIGDRYGLSRERIRQIQQKALGKLRRAF